MSKWHEPNAKERLDILNNAKTIAIVGASDNPARASYFVATYLQSASDYKLFFINPLLLEYFDNKTGCFSIAFLIIILNNIFPGVVRII